MIPVSDLLLWANEHAIGRSPSYPKGWIRAEDLHTLSIQVKQNDPLNFYYSMPRKTGKWIEHNDDFGLTYECSNCHIEGMINGNYCYNCGARMVTEDV